jgi:hypothetical protein
MAIRPTSKAASSPPPAAAPIPAATPLPGTPLPGAAIPDPTEGQLNHNYNLTGGAAPARIMNLLNDRHSAAAVSPAGKDFIARLRALITLHHDKCPLVLEEKMVDETAVVVIRDAAQMTSVLLIMGESVPARYTSPQQDNPNWQLLLKSRLSLMSPEEIAALDASQRPLATPHPCTWMTISVEDYTRADQVYTAVRDKIKAVTVGFVLNDFRAGTPCQLFCTSDMNLVRDFVSRNSPHAIPGRMDYGFVLCILQDGVQYNPNKLGPDGIPQGFTPIVAVGAYT